MSVVYVDKILLSYRLLVLKKYAHKHIYVLCTHS